jgi:ligand-binding SRPBCC domain-containing protein
VSGSLFLLIREQYLPAAPARVFPFFADAHNLERITPPWLGFQIVTPAPIDMHEGTRIDYRLRLAGLPLRWRTVIREWKPGERFVDEQEQGPYALWRHEHVFTAAGEGTLMLDRVHYRLPLGPLGRAAHALAVRATLATIFDYRFDRIRKLWPCPR